MLKPFNEINFSNIWTDESQHERSDTVQRILLPRAERYGSYFAHFPPTLDSLSRLLSHLSKDKSVHGNYLLGVFELCEKDWVDELYKSMINHLIDEKDACSEAYQTIFSDFSFITILSFISPTVAISIMNEGVLRKVILSRPDDELALFYGWLCSRYSELSAFIFTSTPSAHLEELIFKLRRVIEHAPDAPMRLSRIFTAIIVTNDSSREFLSQETKDRLLSKICESEKATIHLTNVMLNMYPRHPICQLISKENIVLIGEKHPICANKIVKALLNDDNYLSYVCALASVIKKSAENSDPSCLETYTLLLLTGIATPQVAQDIHKAFDVCHQMHDYGYSNFLISIAEALANGEAPESCRRPLTSQLQLRVPKHVDLALRLFQLIVKRYPNPVAKKYFEDPIFRYDLAEHFQTQGNYDIAITLYNDISERVERELSKPKDEASNRDEKRENTLGHIRKEAKLRLPMAWIDRLEYFNKNIHKNPHEEVSLCFNLAKHFYVEEKFLLSFRLLMTAVAINADYWNDKLCLDLAFSLIYKGTNPELSVAMLKQVPNSSTSYSKAQNLLGFVREVNYDPKPAHEDQDLLSRKDILEYVQPYYEEACTTGLKDATTIYNRLGQSNFSYAFSFSDSPSNLKTENANDDSLKSQTKSTPN